MQRHILLLFFAVISVAAKAQFSNTDWTPEYHVKFKTITTTTLSPKGDYVAYVVSEIVMEGIVPKHVSQIWIASTQGGFNEQLTGNDQSSYAPQFSPDGRNIAFLSEINGLPQIHTMDLMEYEAKQVSYHDVGVEKYKWGIDGQSFYFIQKQEIKKATNNDRNEAMGKTEFKQAHLYKLALENNKSVTQLTDASYNVTSFSMSPDGNKIAFSFGYDSAVSTDYFNSDIRILNLKSGETSSIVRRTGIDRNPVFSPDGKLIVFETTNGEYIPGGTIDLNVVNLNTQTISELPKTPNRDASVVAWDASGDKLYFSETIHTSGSCLIMNIDNSIRRSRNTIIIKNKTVQVTNRSLLTNTEGTSSAFDFSENGLMSFVYETPESPQEVYIRNLNTDDVVQVSRINEILDMPPMGKTEVIKWKTSDGREIEGLITYPIGYYEGQKCPIILNVHGKSRGVFTKTFTGNPSVYMIQYFAENGFAVFRPNPRGSTGYGSDFRQVGFRDWGFDLITGLDELINIGVADPENQFLMSWSYGDYMTSFAVSKSKRFKAASVGAGMPNVLGLASPGQISALEKMEAGVDLWSNLVMKDQESLVFSVKNVRTPTQVIHEENNIYIPRVTGSDFLVSLKINGVDSEIVLYPEIPNSPQNMNVLMDVSGKVVQWFERYLE